MDHMRDLAAMGHTVVASIHQPRSAIWDMFHKVTVLSEGYQLYFGRPDRALAWFSDALGYDYDLLRDGAVSDWMKSWIRHMGSERKSVPILARGPLIGRARDKKRCGRA